MQMSWMLRLNNATAAAIDLPKVKAELGFQHPIIGKVRVTSLLVLSPVGVNWILFHVTVSNNGCLLTSK